MDSRVAKRYARAIFSAAQKAGAIVEVESDLGTIAQTMKSNPKFADLVLSPKIRRDEKALILQKLFEGKVHSLTYSAIRLLLAKRREEELEALSTEFTALRREFDGAVQVTVTSSSMLDNAQREAIVAKVKALTGKQLDTEFKEDATLLGGVRVAYGNTVVDATVRGSLEKLREAFRYNLLKQA